MDLLYFHIIRFLGIEVTPLHNVTQGMTARQDPLIRVKRCLHRVLTGRFLGVSKLHFYVGISPLYMLFEAELSLFFFEIP